MVCLSGIEHLVGTSHLEALNIHEPADGATLVVQVNHHRIVLDLHILKRRTHTDDGTHAVSLIQRQESQTLAHLLLLGRVNLRAFVGVNTVVGTYQPTVGDNLRSLKLLFLQLSVPRAIGVTTDEGSYLYEVERYLAQLELAAPLLYQQLQTL